MKKHPYRYAAALVAIVLIGVIAESLPVLSGYGAKVLCSAVFVGGRNPDSAQKQDLGHFPFNLARFTVNTRDSSVTGTVWGLALCKAVYRRGLGATLVNGLTEASFRRQAALWVAHTPDSLLPSQPGIATAQDTIDWPDGNRVSRADLNGALAPQMAGRGTGIAAAAILNRQMAGHGTRTAPNSSILDAALDREVSAHGTRAIVVLYRGRIIGERYAQGFGPNTPLAGWSMTKSVTSALLGILVRQRKLDVQAPAPIQAWKDDARSQITTRDLMRMRSGLRWWEFYFGPSRCTRMLFKEPDMGLYAAQSSLRHPPESVFNYSSGSANILSLIIRNVLDSAGYAHARDASVRGTTTSVRNASDTPVRDTSGYYRWPYEQLFHRIGMRHAVLEPDAGGTFVGSSYCYATARDWARFGLFFLQDGVWDGQRILPEGWVNFLRTGPGVYGALWWLNGGRWPHIPADCFCANGYEGQYICIIPSRDLVVVRLALDLTHPNPDRLVGDILQALPTK